MKNISIKTDIEDEYVINTYEKIANAFSSTRPKTWDWIDKFYLSLPNKQSNILDIGCGSGRNMNNLPNTNHLFTGIDTCKEFLKIAKSNTLNVILSDMCNLPFNYNTFDAMISIASFHHLSNISRREQALQSLYNVMKPDCKCLMSVWSITQPKNSKNYNKFVYGDNYVPWKNKKGQNLGNRYYYIFQKEELENLLILSGFIIEKWEWIYGNEVITFIK